ncbi:MAG: type IX secretion system outer membrane channel protein PorV [Salibacteraceae bacterium]
MRFRIFSSVFVLGILCSAVQAQQGVALGDVDGGTLQLNTITTAVPFLIINPETRGGGMGDVGVATSADANSLHWNVGKLAFIEKKSGASISYTPWLRALVPDISLSYLTGYYKIDNMSAAAVSLRYFSLGNIQFTDQFGNNTIQFTPNEFSLNAGYSRKLSDRFSGGLSAKFISSNLTGGQTVGGANSRPGRSVAVDLGVYYENDDLVMFDKDLTFAWGAAISNLGAKISYTDAATRDFLPMNLRLGPRFTWDLNDYNALTFSVDLNKYLVPTPPKYAREPGNEGQTRIDDNGNPIVSSGLDPDRPVATAVFTSFYDAPGYGDFNDDGDWTPYGGGRFREEINEVAAGVGVEYWYAEQFAFRMGYFTEHFSKGNRKFVTLGAGLKLNVFSLDFSYLISTYNVRRNQGATSPLANTLRFTLSFDFDEVAKSDED